MSKRNLLLVLITIILLAMLVLAVAGGRRFPLVNKAVSVVMLPVQEFLNSALHMGDDVRDFWRSLTVLRSENEILQREIRYLRQQTVEMSSLIVENRELRELMAYKKEHPKQELVAAKVVARDYGDLRDTVYINKGIAEGISQGMAVVTEDGLVGIVDEVYGNYARVLLLLSPNCRVGCRVLYGGKGVDGIIRGGHETNSTLLMEHIQWEAELHEGDFVVTNGYSGRHPEGILIGKITKFRVDNAGLLWEASVKPFAEIRKMEYVLVIKDFSPRLGIKDAGGRKQ